MTYEEFKKTVDKLADFPDPNEIPIVISPKTYEKLKEFFPEWSPEATESETK